MAASAQRLQERYFICRAVDYVGFSGVRHVERAGEVTVTRLSQDLLSVVEDGSERMLSVPSQHIELENSGNYFSQRDLTANRHGIEMSLSELTKNWERISEAWTEIYENDSGCHSEKSLRFDAFRMQHEVGMITVFPNNGILDEGLIDLLSNPPPPRVKPGKVSNAVIEMDQAAAASFLHELFGHSFERSYVGPDTIPMPEKSLSVFREFIFEDDPSIEGLLASEMRDSQGVPAGKKKLAEKGRIHQYLGDCLTSRTFPRTTPGNARISTAKYPTPRMSNFIVRADPLGYSPEADIKLCGSVQAKRTASSIFIRPLSMLINGVRCLGSIQIDPCFIGDTEVFPIGEMKFGNLGYCGRGDHNYLPVGYGNPGLCIKGLTVELQL